MSRNIQYADYPLNVDKKKVQMSMDEFVRHEDWDEGASGTPNPIRWVDRVYESYEEAQAAIEKEDQRIWYNCMAVKYKDVQFDALRKSKPTKKETELSAAARAQMNNVNKIIEQSSIQNRTSEYIGCEKCGSKLKRILLKGQSCPLCGADLRSKTNLERIANAKARHAELAKKRDAEIQKRVNALMKTSGEIRWLVKIEYHT